MRTRTDLWLVLFLAPLVASAEESTPIGRDARDVATAIVRAHLSAAASVDHAEQQLRMELIMAQKLLRRAIDDAARGRDSGALQILGAECQRLRPEVGERTRGSSTAAREGWVRIDAALAELCAEQGKLAAAGEPSRKHALGAALRERVERVHDPLAAQETPVIRLPSPDPR
jgi:hypothetical protein